MKSGSRTPESLWGLNAGPSRSLPAISKSPAARRRLELDERYVAAIALVRSSPADR